MTQLIDICAPIEQEGTRSVVRAWLKSIGDLVALDDGLVELETDKVALEVPAPAGGILAEILVESGVEVEPGALLGRMTTGKAEAETAAPAQAPEPAAEPASAPVPAGAKSSIADFDPTLNLSPSVRRRLMERQIDPRDIAGSGRGGRITREDVDGYATTPSAPKPVAAAKAAAPSAHPPTAAPSRELPHDTMRRRIAARMSESLATAPHVTAVFEADFSAIMAHRKAHKPAFERQGVNLTFTAYIIQACVEAMKVAPAVNSRWHDDFLEIFGDVNIGVGTALGDKGLIVPVVQRAQSLSLLGVAQSLQDLIDRARAGKLKPADVANGTFSISNHGVSGSLLAAPIIINQPQSAILGIGKLEKRVVVREIGGVDAIQIRPMAYVSLSIDHRSLDGHQTNSWLSRFVEVLETWPPT